MHEDLTNLLRRCGKQKCKNCEYEHVIGCVTKLNEEAADAIEAQDRHILTLQHEMMAEAESHIAEVNRLNKQIDELANNSPKVGNGFGEWTPVTELLPKTRESILGKKSSKVIVAFRFDDGTQGTDTAHTLNGEWVFEDHITVVARTITHWMPLPVPLKEES